MYGACAVLVWCVFTVSYVANCLLCTVAQSLAFCVHCTRLDRRQLSNDYKRKVYEIGMIKKIIIKMF